MENRVSAHIPESLLTWGKVENESNQPLVADNACDMTVRVKLSRALKAGQSIEAWIHFVSDIEQVQTEDSAGGGYFSCDAGDLESELFVHRGKVHGPATFFPYRRYAGVCFPDGAPENSELLFRFCNTRMQTYEESLFNLRFAVLEGDELLGYLGDAFSRVVGGPMHHLLVVAPTCVVVDEPFDVHIVVRDRWRNKTGVDLENLSFDVGLEGNAGELPYDDVCYDSKRRKHTLRNVRLAKPGACYVRAEVSGKEGIRGLSNPVIVRECWPERVYWGDTHQHSYFADGRGRPKTNYEFAVSHSCLDFCAVTPHQEDLFSPPRLHLKGVPAQEGWGELVDTTEACNTEEIVTILGSEAGSLGRLSGHMNSYYLDHTNRPELERLSGGDRDALSDMTYDSYLRELESSSGEFLLLPHAHAAGGPGKFDLPKRPEYQTNVEVVSVHGVYDVFYLHWLKKGHFVGVHGGGDNHMTSTGNGNPGWHYTNTNGLTGLWSPTRDRIGVWNALKNRRTWAVSGNQRIFLEFSVNGNAMGSIVPGSAPEHAVNLMVAGTAPIMKVDLFRNGEVLRTWRPSAVKHRFLRVLWTDSIHSRRVDDSHTTGSLRLKGTSFRIADIVHLYSHTDSFVQKDDRIEFRANGYSGTTRGVIIELLDGTSNNLSFEVEDQYHGREILNKQLDLSLTDEHAELNCPLEMHPDILRAFFKKDLHHPRFMLTADWIDPGWSRTVDMQWTETGGKEGDWYFVRVEQTDGNIAWSSPVWISQFI